MGGVVRAHFSKSKPEQRGWLLDQGSSSQLCAHVSVSVPAAGVELWALRLCMSTCQQQGRQEPVTGQTECLSTAVGEIHNVHLNTFLLFSHLSCHRGEHGEAIGAVCVHVTAGRFCLCYLCGWPSIYIYRSCTCAPAGNTFSAKPLAGLGGMALWQPCLCQAAGFSHIP